MMFSDLEYEIYLQMDKLIALCTAQAILDNGEDQLPLGVRNHYSLMVEEQAWAVRHCLDRLFELKSPERSDH